MAICSHAFSDAYAAAGGLIGALGVDIATCTFAAFCGPEEILRVGQTNRLSQEVASTLPVCPSFFQLGCRVRVRAKELILVAFQVANRSDITETEAARMAGLEGLVVGQHPTNGVAVLLQDRDDTEKASPRWLEPMCLAHAELPPSWKRGSKRRFLPGQKVHINHKSSAWYGRVGTVELRPALAGGIHKDLLVRYAGQAEETLSVDAVVPVHHYFNGAAEHCSELSLTAFPVGCRVRIRNKAAVLASFRLANRDDYFEYMDTCCGREGVVDLLHVTNGVRVQFPHSIRAFWYEPSSLDLLDPAQDFEERSAHKRLLVGQHVRLRKRQSRYHERVGCIQLHFYQRDYSKVTVRFADGQEEYVNPCEVCLVNSVY